MADQASALHRIWRNLYWWRQDRDIRRRYRGVRHLVYFGGDGIGDELLLSAPLHELRGRGATGLAVMTSRPEFFAHSPDVDFVLPVNHRDVQFLRRVGIETSQATYIHERRPPDIDVPPPHHLLAEMCRRCEIRGPINLRPWLWLTAEERTAAQAWQDGIVVQSSRSSASLAIGNKEWDPLRFQVVVDQLAARHRVLQIGLPADPPLRGAEDLRGRMSLRETAVVLAGARMFLGLVGFLMHLARAVDCPATIVYGGRERPDQSGYPCNENLYSPVPCAPCWRWNSCDFERRCMTSIQCEDVTAAVQRMLSRPRDPLAVTQTILS